MRTDLGARVTAKGKLDSELLLEKKRERKEKLSIYLAKQPDTKDEDLVDLEAAKDPVEIKMVSGKGILYVRKEFPHPPPSWTNLFTSHQVLNDDLFNSTRSVGAVFVVRNFDNVFILTFGTGHHLLNQDLVERDFGLRVTLNSVDPDKLRSLDKASYEVNPLNSRVQSSREVDIFQLRTDAELELVHAITGVSIVPIFGTHVTGRDALTIATSAKIVDLAAILKESLERYRAPLPSQFDWIDNVNRIKDPTEIEILELELDNILARGDFTNLYLGEPEIVDWEGQIGYSFDQYPNTPRHPVLTLDHLIEHLKLKSTSLNLSALKALQIHINNSDYLSTKRWPAYRCLCAEIFYADRYNILRNGIWYKVEPNYLAQVDEFLERTLDKLEYTLPTYAFEREEDYNAELALRADFHLMDQDFIKIGGPSDKVEFCDLIFKGKEWIHVKYYRSSATLSHLFSQGSVAAQAFVGEPEFRTQLNEKLPAGSKLSDPQQRPQTDDYRVVYAIATQKTVPKQLPFFSKVTLKQTVKSLSMLGFKVATTQIPIDPTIYTLKKIKPRKAI